MMNNKTALEQNKVPSVGSRINASLIDYLVILAWMAVIFVTGFTLSLVMGGYPDFLGLLGPIGAQVLFFFVLTFPVGLYLYKSESGAHSATLGKYKLNLMVDRSGGGDLEKRHVLLRTVVKLLPWELAHTFIWQMQYVFYQYGYDADIPVWIFVGLNISIIFVIIFLGMIALRKDGRAPHDLVAGTRVVLS